MKQTSREIEQVRFIERWHEGEVTFVELCRQFAISRTAGYKRVERFKTRGVGMDWETEAELPVVVPIKRHRQ